MAKSMRSKKEKRLRAIRREMVQPLYENKDVAKLAAQEAALAAPKLAVRNHNKSTDAMDLTTTSTSTSTISTTTNSNIMEVEMAEDNQSMGFLKPVGKIGKKLRKKIKIAKGKSRGKGKGKGKISKRKI